MNQKKSFVMETVLDLPHSEESRNGMVSCGMFTFNFPGVVLTFFYKKMRKRIFVPFVPHKQSYIYLAVILQWK